VAEPRDYLVWLEHPAALGRLTPNHGVLDRMNLPSDAVYRTWEYGFGARLTTSQVAALHDDPDVLDVQPDAPGRPAPYRRTASANRVTGSYLVMMEPDSDPAATAFRAGVDPTGLYRVSLKGFGATMTDRELDIVRHSPGVTWVMDDILVSPQ
jgi:hypothetical protein